MTTTSLSRTARRRWWWASWGLTAVLAIGIAGYAVPPYLSGNPEASNVPVNPDVALHYLTLAVHALPGGLALIIGPFQFVSRLRARSPRLHRLLGRIYLISVVVAAVASLFAATFSLSGFSIRVAFYILAVAWLYTAAKAYRTIRRGEVALHRVWMIRNYALTFAAVTLRIYLITGLAVKSSFPGLEFEAIYDASGWASILVNVLVAEYFIVQRTLAPLARTRRSTKDSAPVPGENLVGTASPGV
ncbi:DUF2306 domain-containing protein [Lentzea albidocapillata]|uniref:Uncharacterized membrane protein n=1 Tax=Lentzea albidocapillata TaxID=40571 RepID=A0A1W2E126_9PSEU|nr:DUF2306 domain-containing protein [Lentzea albidocapillata]SMD03495.1 Uncharacterized membrane protein [Lentzea albidocapillata]